MSTSDFLNKLQDTLDIIWRNLDKIEEIYYPATDIYDFTNISFSAELVHWTFVTYEGEHICDARPIKDVFDQLGIEI